MPDATLTTCDDQALMAAIATGSQPAFAELFNRHSGIVLAVCFRLLSDRDEAEDVMLNVFWEVWRRSDRYDATRANPRGYLLTLARSRAIDHRRSRAAQRHTLIGDDEAKTFERADTNSGAEPAQNVAGGEQKQRIRGALNKLPPSQQQVMNMAFLDGLSHADIADKLNKPLGSIKSAIRLGLIQLREMLRITDGNIKDNQS